MEYFVANLAIINARKFFGLEANRDFFAKKKFGFLNTVTRHDARNEAKNHNFNNIRDCMGIFIASSVKISL